MRGNTDAPRGNNHWCVAHLSLIHSGPGEPDYYEPRRAGTRRATCWKNNSHAVTAAVGVSETGARGMITAQRAITGDSPCGDYSHTEA